MTSIQAGVELTSNRNIIQKTKTQTNKAVYVCGRFHEIIWKNKHIKNKMKICNIMVWPILPYATETGANTKRRNKKEISLKWNH